MAFKEIGLTLTDEHRILRDSLRQFGREVLRPASIAIDTLTPTEVVQKDSLLLDVYKQMYALDYHTVLLPSELGGTGLDPLGIQIFYEELGYASGGLAIGLGAAGLHASFASMANNPKMNEKWVIPYINCKDASIIGCWAITEPNHGSDMLAVGLDQFRDPKISQQVLATRKGDKWVLNGQKSSWVSVSPLATHAGLFCGIDTSKGMIGGGLFIIDLSIPGISKGVALNKLGQRDLPQGEIFFDNAEIPGDSLIFGPDMYEGVLTGVLGHANLLMGSIFTGVAQSALDLALKHCSERTQGGKLLCEHQLVQKTLFDMFRKVEVSRAMNRAAMQYNLASGTLDLKYSIISKVTATDTAFEVANEAVQLFGGYGLSKEYPIEKIFRDARSSRIEDGSNEVLSLVAAHKLIKDFA